MKKILILIGTVAVVAFLCTNSRSGAQDRAGMQPWEYAIVKWDGPDKVQYILPNKFDYVRMFEEGRPLPKNAENEEFCLTMAANKLAKEGWEAVNLDSRRILFRRPAH
jgi:hypothetical protein